MAAARIRIDLASKRAVEATFSADSGPRTVLIVDHDLRSRSLLQARLEADGFLVTFAASAIDAIRVLSPGRPLPSIVVAEADLPGDDGFELCAFIRADARTAALPVLLLSRTSDAERKLRAGSVGADDFLARPVFANDILSLVRLLSGGHMPNADVVVDTEELPVHRVVRALLSGVRSGRLEAEGGYLSFRDGRIVDARFGALTGAAALTKILLLTDGEYTVAFGPALGRAEVVIGLEEFCRRFEPIVARFEEVLSRALPLDAVLAVDFAKLAEHLHHLPDEVNALVRLFDGRRRVRDVILEGGFVETTTLEAATRLYMMGVLGPVAEGIVATPKVAPRFMEPEPASAIALNELFGPAEPPAPEPAPQPAPDWLVNKMSPELQAQLDAFGVKEVAEPLAAPEMHVSQMDVFVAGVDAYDSSLEDAINASLVSHEDLAAEEQELAAPVAEAEFDIDVVEPVAVEEPSVDPRRPMLGALGITLGVVAVAAGLAFAIGRPPEPRKVSAPVEVAKPAVGVAPAEAPVEPEGPSLEQGIAFMEAGFVADAVGLLEQVVLRDDDAAAWSMLGVARFESGDVKGAEMAAMKTLELNPKDSQARMLLATMYIDARDHDLADEQLKKIIELDPNGAHAVEARELLGRKKLPKKAPAVVEFAE